jgi:hypothetical protein
MRQNVRRNSKVVLDHLGFGELRSRVQHLAQTGALDGVAVDFQRNFVSIAGRHRSGASRLCASFSRVGRLQELLMSLRLQTNLIVRDTGALFCLRRVNTAPLK